MGDLLRQAELLKQVNLAVYFSCKGNRGRSILIKELD